MDNPEIDFLIIKIKQGDLASFEMIYKRYYSKLYSFSQKFDSSTLQPDDFVQQSFLKLWDEKDKLREDVLFDKQLFTICKNLILNHLKREKKVLTNQAHNLNLFEAHNETVEVDSTKDWDKLNELIKKMPEKRQEVFMLHKIENLSYQEIADYLCISKKTIANHVYLANNFLKNEIRNS